MDQTVRGHQPAGPNRWKRAAQWAEEKPHTAQAKKYLAREAAARTIAVNHGHQAWLHYYKPVMWRGEADPVYEYQTCTTAHAILQLQLDLGVAGLEELHEKVLDGPHHFMSPRPATSTRKGKCKVCGGNVV